MSFIEYRKSTPCKTLMLIILNGFSASGTTVTTWLILSPTVPFKTAFDGVMDAKFLTSPVSFRLNFELAGSLVSTLTTFSI